MQKNFRIRALGKSDIPDILEIERLSFSESWSSKLIERELSLPISHTLGAEINGKVVGYVIFWIVRETCELHRIAVHPDFRKRGIGTALMEKFLKTALEKGAEEIVLEVEEENRAALSLYMRFGFSQISIRKNYYGNRKAVILRLKLNSRRKAC